ncbi:MAG: DEAD/DEAH box helicase [Treponema sp.]|jgi:ATP-dependent RNA helicase RhlB|nr:DEAD/DEAH box helicase [Treponema sp.]
MPVQEQVLTNAFGGQDLYVQSQTGTGKTAAFLIVIFQRLLTESILNGKKAIIMVPTRELAVQVEEEAKALGKYLPFRIGSFYGGVGYGEQERLLRNQVQILVGTPGRVLDLNSSGKMHLMDIAFLVLDEADRMFDMGFYPDLRKLIKAVPPADRRQTMLFSATLNNWVKNLAWEYTKNPREIEIAPEQVTVEEIDQILYHVSSENKIRLLLGILERENPESAIIFCNTKRYAEIVAKRLRINGIACEFIMGDLPQSKRLQIIEGIKGGDIRFLAATDVAARGLDIEALALVVNFDLPVESENYVHRIGRTARAGKSGKAITLASEQDVYELPGIERYIGKKIPSEIAGEELLRPDKSAGMRIRTDFLSRDGGRPFEGRPTMREAKGRRERNREGPAGSRLRDKRPAARRERRPSGERAPGGPPPACGSGGSGGGNAKPKAPPRHIDRTAGGQDLAKLSFEERMAYYKQKYVPKAAAGAVSPPRSEGRRRGGKGGGAAASAEARREAAPPEARQARKQGVLGKLLSLFKKD